MGDNLLRPDPAGAAPPRVRHRAILALVMAFAVIAIAFTMGPHAYAATATTKATGSAGTQCVSQDVSGSLVLIPCNVTGAPTGYVAPDLLPSAGATSGEQAALNDLEQQAVTNTINDHQLKAGSDGAAAQSWSRADVEAELWALIIQAIEAPNPNTDQQGAIDWLAGEIDAQGLQSAEDAGLEYAKFAGLDTTPDGSGYQNVVGTTGLTAFLNQTPNPFSPFNQPGQGYCDYTAPSPYQGDWQTNASTGFEPCYGPCPPSFTLGCNQPNVPSAQQFETWGSADFASTQAGLYNSPQFTIEAGQIAQALQYAGVLTGTGQGAGLSAPMQAVEGQSALLANLSGFDGLNLSATAGLNAPALSQQELDGILGGALAADVAAGGATIAAGSASAAATVSAALADVSVFSAISAEDAADIGSLLLGSAIADLANPVGLAVLVLLGVVAAVIEGVKVFDQPDTPGQLAGIINDYIANPDHALAAASGEPQSDTAEQDLAAMLADPTESLTLYSLFVAATLNPPFPGADACAQGSASGSTILTSPGETAAQAEASLNGLAPCDTPLLQICPNADLSSEPILCDAPPLPTATDESFQVLNQGGTPALTAGACTNCTIEHSISFQDGSTTTPGTGTITANDDWFVDTEQPAGAGPTSAQTLRINYIDWSGVEQNAWLVQGSAGPVFVGYPTPAAGSSALDPSTCLQDGSCWTSPWIDFVTPDGTKQMASVAAVPGGGTSDGLPHLGISVSTDTVDPLVNTTQGFGASLQVVQNGIASAVPASDDVSFSWQFQEICPGASEITPITFVNGMAVLGTPIVGPLLCFPDGGALGGSSVSHTWAAPGIFEVQVTAKDNTTGLTATDTFSVTVGGTPPTVSASLSCPTGQGTTQDGVAVCSGPGNQVVDLSATIQHEVATEDETVAVNWGDGAVEGLDANASGNTSTGKVNIPRTDTFGATFGTPSIALTGTHTYKSPGVYPVTISVEDQSGQTATTTVTAVVQGGSQAITLEVPTDLRTGAVEPLVYGGGAETVSAQGGDSGQPVTLTSTTPAVCSVGAPTEVRDQAGQPARAEFSVTPLAAGTCTLAADQAGIVFTDQQADQIPVYSAAPEVTQDITVQQRVLLGRAVNQSMTFGGAVPSFTATFTGLVSGDPQSVVTGVTCAPVDHQGNPLDAATAAPGTYNVKCSGGTAANYTIQNISSGTLTIGKAPLTVTADDQTMTYGGTVPALTASAGSGQLAGGDTLATAVPDLACVAEDASGNVITPATAGAGTYAIDCSGTSTDYGLTFVAGTLTINKAPLTVTGGSGQITYGDALPSTSPVVQGLVNGDTLATAVPDLVCNPIGGVEFAPLTQATATPGTYPVACSGTSADYSVTFLPGELKILPVSLTVTADDQTITYGQPLPALTATVTGFVNGDTQATALLSPPTCTTTATAGSPAGTYPITCSAFSAHYLIDFVAGTLTIAKAPLTITAQDQQMTYGGDVPTFVSAASGLVNGDTLAGAVTGLSCGPVDGDGNRLDAARAGAGTYAIDCSGTSANYDLTVVRGTLTINRAALTVTADDQTMTYGGTVPALTVTYSGLVNGDTAATALTTQPACTTTAAQGSPVGTYSITCSGAVSPDYTISFAGGTLTVGKAPLTVTAQNQTMTYGQAAPTFNAFFGDDQLVNGDTPATAVKGLSCGPVDADGNALDASIADAGTYQIDCSGTSTDYGLSFVAGQLTISRAQTTASLTATTSPSGSLTLNAAVVPSLTPVDGAAGPSGSVEFQVDGGALISLAGSLSANGTATTTISSLLPGQHQITLTYAGDANYVGSTAGQTLIVACTQTTTDDGRTGPTCGVVDGDLALVNVPQTLTVDAAAGATGAAVDYAVPAAENTDGDTTATVTCTPAPNTVFPIGKTAVTCTATDPDAATTPVTATFDVIVEAPLEVSISTLPAGQVGVPYTTNLTATGGTGTYTWSVVSGTIPGLTVASDGSITGTPTQPGTFTVVVSVNDPVMATLSLTITPASGAGPGGTGTGTTGTGTGTSGTGTNTGTTATSTSTGTSNTGTNTSGTGTSTSTNGTGTATGGTNSGPSSTSGDPAGSSDPSAEGSSSGWLAETGSGLTFGVLGGLLVIVLGLLLLVLRPRRRRTPEA